MIRVVLADDHPVVTDGLRRFFDLVPDIEVIEAVCDLPGLRRSVQECAPQVVVVDLNMPGMQGATSVTELVAQGAGPAVVVFSMQQEDQYAVKLLRAGARAYLSKSRPPTELAHAVRLAARGARYLTDDLSARLLSDTGENTHGHAAFSAREREVFDALVAGSAAKLVAKELGISVSTVHTYTERIKIKLAVDSVSEIVSYAFRHGLAR